ncbi:MAG: hypothetical protein WAM91_17855 [Candidatus Acidiferrales bacterium]
MPFTKRILSVSVFVCAFGLLICRPGVAQSCAGTQDGAVDCFVKNAVTTGLLAVPTGMTMSQYKSYGIAVSKVMQTPSAAMFLLGMAGAAADAAPPTNADGSANQAAQDALVNAIVTAGLNDGMIALPSEATSNQLEMFARALTASMSGSSVVTISPGGFLRVLDGYTLAATQTNGTINWLTVTTNITSLVGALQTTGLIKLPAGITLANVEQFALDAASAIVVYKTATGKAHL